MAWCDAGNLFAPSSIDCHVHPSSEHLCTYLAKCFLTTAVHWPDPASEWMDGLSGDVTVRSKAVGLLAQSQIEARMSTGDHVSKSTASWQATMKSHVVMLQSCVIIFCAMIHVYVTLKHPVLTCHTPRNNLTNTNALNPHDDSYKVFDWLVVLQQCYTCTCMYCCELWIKLASSYESRKCTQAVGMHGSIITGRGGVFVCVCVQLFLLQSPWQTSSWASWNIPLQHATTVHILTRAFQLKWCFGRQITSMVWLKHM